jgi:hypothetical protein
MLDGTRMSIFQKIFSEGFNRIYHSGCELLYTVQLPGTGNKMVHGVLASTSTCSTHCTLHISVYMFTGPPVDRYETLELSMELNDDILVQTTPPQTIARVKRVKCFMLQKVA